MYHVHAYFKGWDDCKWLYFLIKKNIADDYFIRQLLVSYTIILLRVEKHRQRRPRSTNHRKKLVAKATLTSPKTLKLWEHSTFSPAKKILPAKFIKWILSVTSVMCKYLKGWLFGHLSNVSCDIQLDGPQLEPRCVVFSHLHFHCLMLKPPPRTTRSFSLLISFSCFFSTTNLDP